MRTFRLLRTEDESGVSGIGYVAEGIVFSDGRTFMVWYGKLSSVGMYDSLDDLIAIHGHGGKTVVEFDHYVAKAA